MTKRQNSVAASSREAEYMALFEAVREALWLKSLLFNIAINISEPITICLAYTVNLIAQRPKRRWNQNFVGKM